MHRIILASFLTLHVSSLPLLAAQNSPQNTRAEIREFKEHLVEGLPEVPVFPGARVEGSYEKKAPGRVGYGATWTVGAPVSKVVAWFRRELPRRGWKILEYNEGDDEQNLLIQKGERKAYLWVERDGNVTEIAVEFPLAPEVVARSSRLLRAADIPTPANLKVAFIGDSGAGSKFTRVLNLIKNERAQAVFHQGDFDYGNNPRAFFRKVDSELGANFPYFASVGNHDAGRWSTRCLNTDGNGCYATFLIDRMRRIGVTPDHPDLNDEMYSVVWNGLKVVFVGQKEANNTKYADYITSQFTGDAHIWKISSWHENQRKMQVGGKGDEMGWGVYENSRKAGALIVTGHEHSYHRTVTLSSTVNQTPDPVLHPPVNGVPSNPNRLRVQPGAVPVIVSGLAGHGIRDQERCPPFDYPYGGGADCNHIWAKIYTLDQNAEDGALFITFHVGGDPRKARAEFKTITGQTIDEFELTAGAP